MNHRKKYGLTTAGREGIRTEEGLASLNSILCYPSHTRHMWSAAMLYYCAVTGEEMDFGQLHKHLTRYVRCPSKRYWCVKRPCPMLARSFPPRYSKHSEGQWVWIRYLPFLRDFLFMIRAPLYHRGESGLERCYQIHLLKLLIKSRGNKLIGNTYRRPGRRACES